MVALQRDQVLGPEFGQQFLPGGDLRVQGGEGTRHECRAQVRDVADRVR
jgi:hypothetical protein